MEGLIDDLISKIESEISEWNSLNIYSEPKPECRDYGVREQDLFIKCKWHERINQIHSFFISNHLTNEELKNKINELKERIETIEEKSVEEYRTLSL